ncbi:MAG TPA: aldo/keto reductase [Tepidisphaeraceae bacterium]|jgi:aryl-alcohol dehydrogenase-like predicted oxidoreductase
MTERRPLGNTGYDVSPLGFGGAPSAFLKSDAPTTARMLESMIDNGMNLIDTAMSYPGSEEFIGNHLSHRRSEVVIVSKCGQRPPGSDAPAWSAAAISFAVDRSLRLLKTDHVDVMLLHTCDLQTLQSGEAIDALVEARRAGKIRFAGYSGDNEALAYAAAHEELAVLEASINIVDQKNIDLGLPIARENNKGVIAKRPVANACWKDPASQPGMYQKYSAGYSERLAKMNLTPADLGFDGDASAAWPEIALRFTLGQPGVSTAVVGTTNPVNAASNERFAARGPLDDVVVQKIRAAFAKADPSREWKGET